MDVSDVCAYCHDNDCINCEFANPCLGCEDYDEEHDRCKSDGACGKEIEDERF